jgi:hypothetical protein
MGDQADKWLPQCELRIAKAAAMGGKGNVELVCGAGEISLGSPEPDNPALRGICGECDVPAALASPSACLYLVPIRAMAPEGLRSYYACRWFYSLNPRLLPTSVASCQGCPYWFPRPPLELIKGYWDISGKVLHLFLGDRPLPKRAVFQGWARKEERKRWWQHLWPLS